MKERALVEWEKTRKRVRVLVEGGREGKELGQFSF